MYIQIGGIGQEDGRTLSGCIYAVMMCSARSQSPWKKDQQGEPWSRQLPANTMTSKLPYSEQTYDSRLHFDTGVVLPDVLPQFSHYCNHVNGTLYCFPEGNGADA